MAKRNLEENIRSGVQDFRLCTTIDAETAVQSFSRFYMV